MKNQAGLNREWTEDILWTRRPFGRQGNSYRPGRWRRWTCDICHVHLLLVKPIYR